MRGDPIRQLKVMIVGDTGVGKTSLLNYYINGSSSSDPTDAVDMFFKKLKIRDMTLANVNHIYIV